MSNKLDLHMRLNNLIKLSDPHIVHGMEFVNTDEVALKAKQAASDSLSWVGNKLWDGIKYTGGKVGESLTKGINLVNKELLVSVGTNNMVIKNFLDKIKEDDKLVDEYDVPGKLIISITTKGKLETLYEDIDVLIDTIDVVEKYADDLNHYLGKVLSTVFGFMKCKEEDEFLKNCEEFEGLKVPHIKYAHGTDNGSESDLLPGGRHFCFKLDEGNAEYFIRTENMKSTAQIYEPNKDSLKTLLNKLKSLNETHSVIKKINDQYATFLKKWGEDIKAVYTHIHSLDSLSSETKNAVNKILDKPPTCLVFYGSFIPKSVIYLDGYISDVIQLTKKLIKN